VTTASATADQPVGALPADGGVGRVEDRRLVRLLVAGIVLACGLGALLIVSFVVSRDLFVRIAGVITASFVGGRMPGILTSLEVGFDGWTTVFLLILLNTTWLFLAIPLIKGLSRRASRSRLFDRFRAGKAGQASAQAETVSRYGSWALPFFIWLPFPLTGAVVGALIGLILGIPLRRLMYTVVLSMWTGIVMWTFGMEFVYLFAGTTGKIVCYTVTAGVLGYSLAMRVRRPAP
jgi:uncharacterized membrane protein